jgi:hypothetical protein
MSYDIEGWDQLRDEIGDGADRWLDVIEDLIVESNDYDVVMSIAGGPLPAVLKVGGTQLERRAIDWAQGDGKRVSALFRGLSLGLTPNGQEDGESLAVHALGLTIVADACARQVGQPPNSFSWDLWTVDLSIQMTESDPQFIWELIQLVVARVPPENLGQVGAGLLEDFCWSASEEYIDRIEARASEDVSFKAALGSVWPGRDTIPPAIYARIRKAAGSAGSPYN